MTTTGFMSRVVPTFSLGLLMTGVGSYFGWNLPAVFLFGAMIAELILVFTSSKWAYSETANANIGLFLVFTTLTGMTLVPILHWANYRGGPGLIAQALGVTVLTFAALAGYGATTKKDFSAIGGFLFMALIGIIIASIINIFVGGTMLTLTISVISVVVFSGFVLYDMSVIRRNFSDRDYIVASLALYLDFILLFQNILQILGILSSDDR
jgi:FtsH-binding integral membrane protein